MSAAESKPVWTEANQAFLVREFARLKRHLAGEPASAAAMERADDAPEQPPAIQHLCDVFGLSAFERNILILCAGVEMDSRLAAQCAEAQGNAPRACATLAWRWPPCRTRTGAP